MQKASSWKPCYWKVIAIARNSIMFSSFLQGHSRASLMFSLNHSMDGDVPGSQFSLIAAEIHLNLFLFFFLFFLGKQ